MTDSRDDTEPPEEGERLLQDMQRGLDALIAVFRRAPESLDVGRQTTTALINVGKADMAVTVATVPRLLVLALVALMFAGLSLILLSALLAYGLAALFSSWAIALTVVLLLNVFITGIAVYVAIRLSRNLGFDATREAVSTVRRRVKVSMKE